MAVEGFRPLRASHRRYPVERYPTVPSQELPSYGSMPQMASRQRQVRSSVVGQYPWEKDRRAYNSSTGECLSYVPKGCDGRLCHLKSSREDTMAQFGNMNIFRKLGSLSGSW